METPQRYILVDYENVPIEAIDQVDQENSHLILFLGPQQHKLPLDLVLLIQKMGVRGQYVAVRYAGSNSVDLHLVYHLGQMILNDPDGTFFIISKDTGFDPLLASLKDQKKLVYRYPQITDIPFIRQGSLKNLEEKISLAAERLKNHKGPLPNNKNSLANFIQAMFQKNISPEQAEKIVSQLETRKLIKYENSKITYNTV